jgi:two-component system CheB/CheR fusion protein
MPEHAAGSSITLHQAALDASPYAQIVLDPERRVALINHHACLKFRLGVADRGKELHDLELSYRPTDLRSLVDEALRVRRPVTRKDIEHRPTGRPVEFLDIVVTPAFHDVRLVAITLTFSDVTEHHVLQEKLQRFSDNLETAYEELQSANEELETTNEELQSANEELETTNEELQAANEEMETVNEELRSTNDELTFSNGAMRERETEREQTHAFLHAVLGGLRCGVVVVDASLVVQVWNDTAAEMWGVRVDEALGRPLTDIDIGLPIAPLLPLVHEACAGPPGARPRELALAAINRRGRAITCRVIVGRLRLDARGVTVSIVMDEIEGGHPPGGTREAVA